jgi:hypothetical protein
MMAAAGRIVVVLVVLVAVALPAVSPAVPTAYVEPETTAVESGEVFEVQVMVSADADIMSNFRVFVRYDTAVLEFVQALEGALYANSGFQTWFYFNEEPVGTCEVWDVIFPAGSFVLAPGELCKLRFEALHDGLSPVAFLSVDLKDIDRYPIEPVAWTDGCVLVGDLAGIDHTIPEDAESGIGQPLPNPACRGAAVSILLPDRGDLSVSCPVIITDSQGRVVATLDLSSQSLPGCFVWDGRNSDGKEAGAGVYFFRIGTGMEVVSRKVVIVR